VPGVKPVQVLLPAAESCAAADAGRCTVQVWPQVTIVAVNPGAAPVQVWPPVAVPVAAMNSECRTVNRHGFPLPNRGRMQ